MCSSDLGDGPTDHAGDHFIAPGMAIEAAALAGIAIDAAPAAFPVGGNMLTRTNLTQRSRNPPVGTLPRPNQDGVLTCELRTASGR